MTQKKQWCQYNLLYHF